MKSSNRFQFLIFLGDDFYAEIHKTVVVNMLMLTNCISFAYFTKL
jgi:hypothetical protein